MTRGRISLLIIVFVLTMGAWLSLGKQPEPLPEKSLSQSFLHPGSFTFSKYDVDIVDPNRDTDVNEDFPGANERQLKTTIWHPRNLSRGPYPLIVYSHGFSSFRDEATYFAEHLASLGYIVVSADFPLTNLMAPGGPRVQDVINQPGDVSFLIDTLLAWSADSKHKFHGAIHPDKIGAMGTSLGGLTTTLVTYDPHRRDPRIKAAVSIAGPSNFFAKKFFSSTDIPFMMLAGDQDALVDYELNAKPIPEQIPGSILVTINKASHTGFGHGTAALRWMNNPDAIGCYVVKRSLNMEDTSLYGLLGKAEDGIIYDAENRLCQLDPLPTAMNPIHQQKLATLSVSSFFQSYFGAKSSIRKANHHYLTQVMPQELKAVSVQVAER